MCFVNSYCYSCLLWVLWWVWVITCSSYVDHCHSVSFCGVHPNCFIADLGSNFLRRISWMLWVINNGHEQGRLKSYSGRCSDGCCRIIMKCKTQPYVLWPSKFNAEERKSILRLRQMSSETNWLKKRHGRYHEFQDIYSISLSLSLFLSLSLSISISLLYPYTLIPHTHPLIQLSIEKYVMNIWVRSFQWCCAHTRIQVFIHLICPFMMKIWQFLLDAAPEYSHELHEMWSGTPEMVVTVKVNSQLMFHMHT